MSTRRSLGVVAVLAVLVGIALWYSHRAMRHRAPVAVAGAPSNVPVHSNGAAADPSRAAAPSVEMVERDPDAAARVWHARATNVVMAKHRKEFGDEVARLMNLPYDEAWDPLVAKAKDGNVGAAIAVLQMAQVCNAESANSTRRHGTPRPPSTYYKGLPDAWKPFVDRVDALQRNEHDRVRRCDGVGDGFDLAMLFLDQFLTSDHPEAEVEMLADNNDRPQAIADLRDLLAAHDLPRGRYLLGDLLLGSDDAGERTEGRAMLEQLAPDDPEAAMRLGDCLQHGCAGLAPDQAAARRWLEMAAGGRSAFVFASRTGARRRRRSRRRVGVVALRARARAGRLLRVVRTVVLQRRRCGAHRRLETSDANAGRAECGARDRLRDLGALGATGARAPRLRLNLPSLQYS
jgi:hypothetical protein